MESLIWIFILYILPIYPAKNIIEMCVKTMERREEFTDNFIGEKIYYIFKNYSLHLIPVFNLIIFVSFLISYTIDYTKTKNNE
jgi:hypothetical protein